MKNNTVDPSVAMIERLDNTPVKITDAFIEEYRKLPDELPEDETLELPAGYKRCGKCRKIKKYFLFNKNKEAKDNCSGSCKECQKSSAKASYKKTKSRRNYKEYYREHKEEKLAQSKAYYKNNKEKLDEKHREYVNSAKGKKVMQKARKKRNDGLANTGIPYTAEQVWERDCMNSDSNNNPICYLCGQGMEKQSDCHIDHVIGIVIGGPNSFENVAYVHNKCNLTKTKDCREVTVQMSQKIVDMTTEYIELHPNDFK